MKLAEMKRILAENQIQLTKSLGQNFLHDGNQLRRIVAAAELDNSDQILEIGPGFGPLTELLLPNVSNVLAIEKDPRLFAWLAERWSACPALTLIQADALEYLRGVAKDWSTWKMVSNLPYSVASPLLVELAHCATPPNRMVVTVQCEVADRIIASAGTKNFGVLTLLLQSRFAPVTTFKIPASCFFPSPGVDSACVTLTRRPKPLLDLEQFKVFDKIVKRSFSQRRKMMVKLLKTEWPNDLLASAWHETQLPAQIRAEDVTLEQFVQLTRKLASNNGGDRER